MKGHQAIKRSSGLSKKTQILKYEKELLSQEILSLEEKFEEAPTFDDPIICRVNAENSITTSIRNYRQLIIELNNQIGILDLKCENSKKDLFDLKAIGLSLESKVREKKEAIEVAPRSEVEKRKQKVLKELEGQVKKMAEILFQLVDKHYPAKSLQSSVESHFLKLDLSVPSLKSILETLIKQSIENPNQYHQLPWGVGPGRSKSEDLCRQAWEPYLNVLYLSYLIQFHPSDPSQVRLTNYQTFE
ncbi:hypothetical protein DSO57_1026949 [Entomophthora muscae]|nr:hypothetical protein DSO57_1026949 [Entomophthora muscae]